MTGSRISTTVTHTVTVGDGYPSPLTITDTGRIAPVNRGADGVILPTAGDQMTNDGTVASGLDGIGIDVEAGGIVVNHGLIRADGGPIKANAARGAGVLLADGGSAVIAGSVAGGVGGDGPGGDGVSGPAIAFGSDASTLTIDHTSAHIDGAIAGFAAGDVIAVDAHLTSLSFMAGTLTLAQGGTLVEQLTLRGHFDPGGFQLSIQGRA